MAKHYFTVQLFKENALSQTFTRSYLIDVTDQLVNWPLLDIDDLLLDLPRGQDDGHKVKGLLGLDEVDVHLAEDSQSLLPLALLPNYIAKNWFYANSDLAIQLIPTDKDLEIKLSNRIRKLNVAMLFYLHRLISKQILRMIQLFKSYQRVHLFH